MTADEIRKLSPRRYAGVMETLKPEHYEMHRAGLLQEIAAQLAELNTSLRTMTVTTRRSDPYEGTPY